MVGSEVLSGVDSEVLYVGLLGLVVLERLAELAISTRNERRLRRLGGVEEGAGHYPVMVALHTALLFAAPLEVFLLGRPFLPWLGVPMIVALAGTMAVRYWVVATLGERWSTRVICLPGGQRISSGPYRFLRHPNYAAVAVEVAALPLVHTAWITAATFTVLNLLVLRTRIRVEDEALRRYSRHASGEAA